MATSPTSSLVLSWPAASKWGSGRSLPRNRAQKCRRAWARPRDVSDTAASPSRANQRLLLVVLVVLVAVLVVMVVVEAHVHCDSMSPEVKAFCKAGVSTKEASRS